MLLKILFKCLMKELNKFILNHNIVTYRRVTYKRDETYICDKDCLIDRARLVKYSRASGTSLETELEL